MKQNKPLRIGTRASALALWQAEKLQRELNALGYATVLIPIHSEGDQNLTQPLYEMGTVGIFTKALDIALLNNQIDLAIHSMKDVPTQLPNGIIQAAVLERGNSSDILVWSNKEEKNTIATGSLRRKAQWLERYPEDELVPLRGNIQTRLKQLNSQAWNGAVFAAAALERLKISEEQVEVLDWMIPAPAQGALMVVTLEENKELAQILQELNHPLVEKCTSIERDFLRTLEGGCTAPIGAYAYFENGSLHFKGGVFSLQKKQGITLQKKVAHYSDKLGKKWAEEILAQGGAALLKEFKSEQ